MKLYQHVESIGIALGLALLILVSLPWLFYVALREILAIRKENI